MTWKEEMKAIARKGRINRVATKNGAKGARATERLELTDPNVYTTISKKSPRRRPLKAN